MNVDDLVGDLIVSFVAISTISLITLKTADVIQWPWWQTFMPCTCFFVMGILGKVMHALFSK